MPFDDAVTNVGDLRRLYRQPHELVLRKQIDHIDAAARQFIAASPFVVVATAGAGGGDASPRGGPPGFVAVIDDRRLAIGDLAGNNRLDTHTNLLADPGVGLLFLIPGVEETLRVNGRATLTRNPAVLDSVTIDRRRPPLAIGVDVDECFIHCAKAFRRAQLWEPDSWLPVEERPSAACALRDHLQLDVDPKVIEDDLELAYRATLWEPGG